jgi:hypothetical protein
MRDQGVTNLAKVTVQNTRHPFVTGVGAGRGGTRRRRVVGADLVMRLVFVRLAGRGTRVSRRHLRGCRE